MWGLLERTVAVECLATVAGELKKSKADLQGLLPASEYSSLETFFSRTVEAAGHTCPPPPHPPHIKTLLDLLARVACTRHAACSNRSVMAAVKDACLTAKTFARLSCCRCTQYTCFPTVTPRTGQLDKTRLVPLTPSVCWSMHVVPIIIIVTIAVVLLSPVQSGTYNLTAAMQRMYTMQS